MEDVLELLALIEQLRTEHFLLAGLLAWAFMTLIVSFPIPFGSVASVSIGYLFGVIYGTLIIWSAIIVSTALLLHLFRIGSIERRFPRFSWVARFSPYFQSLTQLAILRQVALLPNFVFCVAAAMFQTPRQRVLIATAIGAWPSILLTTYFGNSISQLVEVTDPSARPSALINIAISVFALAVFVFVARRAKVAPTD